MISRKTSVITPSFLNKNDGNGYNALKVLELIGRRNKQVFSEAVDSLRPDKFEMLCFCLFASCVCVHWHYKPTLLISSFKGCRAKIDVVDVAVLCL